MSSSSVNTAGSIRVLSNPGFQYKYRGTPVLPYSVRTSKISLSRLVQSALIYLILFSSKYVLTAGLERASLSFAWQVIHHAAVKLIKYA